MLSGFLSGSETAITAASKARITYLNLPTQIYDPSTNISIKAKSVHGN